MIRVLLKKQLAEIFRNYFYNPKKNQARGKASIVLMFIFFALLMVVMLGGMFTVLSLSMCGGLHEAGIDWLYFAVMGLLSVFLGVFGGVFSTYASLYLAKDNDLLLSMPIPIKTIMTARLLGVYLLGSMYSAVVILPAMIVYWTVADHTVRTVLAGVLFLLLLSLLVTALSCALGWVVAKLSLKLKNKSFITVLISLLFFVGYYIVYFKATALIQDMVRNAAVYGEKIKGAAYGVYLFGLVPTGDGPAVGIFSAAVLALFCATMFVISKSFLKIATASGATAKATYREKTMRAKGAQGALLRKELRRFTASPNYMLNCGLGALILPAAGIALLVKGNEIVFLLDGVFAAWPGAMPVLLFAAGALLVSMVDPAAPSVSLEGKTIWLAQSLPIPAWHALRAKLFVQLLLALPATSVFAVCGGIALRLSAGEFALAAAGCLCYTLLSALFDLFLSVRMANLSWTNEIMPIKQGGSVTVALFSGWGVPLAAFGLYLLIGMKFGDFAQLGAVYLGGLLILCAALCLLLWRWLRTRGAAIFANL